MSRPAEARTVIGVDFDNTVVAYDAIFHSLAIERGLVPASCAASKEAVRDALRAEGREDDWTRLQGYVYGPGMELAEPFPGSLEFFERCHRASVRVVIISHRTRWPYLGERYDLHAAARSWVKRHGLEVDAYFELTKAAKLERIIREGCTHFVDDLPELLLEPAFPPSVARFLFDPLGDGDVEGLPGSIRRMRSWGELTRVLAGDG